MGTCPRPPGPALRPRPVENYTSCAPSAAPPPTREGARLHGRSRIVTGAAAPDTRRHKVRCCAGPALTSCAAPPPDTRGREDPDGRADGGEGAPDGERAGGAPGARATTGRPPARQGGQEAREREREGPEPLGLSRLRACARRARGGTRTPMIVRSHGPEPCASTNSATRARSEADDSRSGPPASNQSDPQTGETRHPSDPSAPPPHPPGHTGYDGPDGSVPAEEPVILGGEEHGVPGQVRKGR